LQAADLELLIATAQDAGRIAKTYFDRHVDHWQKPAGAGPVTEADLAVNAMFVEALQAARPDYGWLSEETEDAPERLDHETIFILDPIDGTRSFLEGSHTWAHSLAVAHKGHITAAVVYLPLREKLYSAARGQGAWLNGERITVSACKDLTGASLLAAKPNYDPQNWRGPVPDVKRFYRPSLAYRLSLVAQGRFDAMLTLRKSWEWDIAAGDLICQEAGAQSSDREGRALCYNNPAPSLNGVVVGPPPLHMAITKALL